MDDMTDTSNPETPSDTGRKPDRDDSEKTMKEKMKHASDMVKEDDQSLKQDAKKVDGDERKLKTMIPDKPET